MRKNCFSKSHCERLARRLFWLLRAWWGICGIGTTALSFPLRVRGENIDRTSLRCIWRNIWSQILEIHWWGWVVVEYGEYNCWSEEECLVGTQTPKHKKLIKRFVEGQRWEHGSSYTHSLADVSHCSSSGVAKSRRRQCAKRISVLFAGSSRPSLQMGKSCNYPQVHREVASGTIAWGNIPTYIHHSILFCHGP